MKTLSEIHLQPKDRQAIDAAVRLLKELFPVRSVTVFGSKATGREERAGTLLLFLPCS